MALQRLEAPGGVVEVGDGLHQRRRRIVGQGLLEVRDGAARQLDVAETLHRLVGLGPFHEEVDAPGVAVGVHVVGLPLKRGNQVQRLAVGIAPGGLDAAAQEGGDPGHVGHQALGVAEDVVVDALHDVAARIGDHPEGVVDVPAAIGLGTLEGALEAEGPGDGGEIERNGGGHASVHRGEG